MKPSAIMPAKYQVDNYLIQEPEVQNSLTSQVEQIDGAGPHHTDSSSIENNYFD